jgi:hypothetical protein
VKGLPVACGAWYRSLCNSLENLRGGGRIEMGLNASQCAGVGFFFFFDFGSV